jgi:hypothetical protein
MAGNGFAAGGCDSSLDTFVPGAVASGRFLLEQMSKRGKILGFGLLVLIVGTVAVLAWWSREPSYRGRRLTSWLQQVSDTHRRTISGAAEAGCSIDSWALE